MNNTKRVVADSTSSLTKQVKSRWQIHLKLELGTPSRFSVFVRPAMYGQYNMRDCSSHICINNIPIYYMYIHRSANYLRPLDRRERLAHARTTVVTILSPGKFRVLPSSPTCIMIMLYVYIISVVTPCEMPNSTIVPTHMCVCIYVLCGVIIVVAIVFVVVRGYGSDSINDIRGIRDKLG